MASIFVGRLRNSQVQIRFIDRHSAETVLRSGLCRSFNMITTTKAIKVYKTEPATRATSPALDISEFVQDNQGLYSVMIKMPRPDYSEKEAESFFGNDYHYISMLTKKKIMFIRYKDVYDAARALRKARKHKAFHATAARPTSRFAAEGGTVVEPERPQCETSPSMLDINVEQDPLTGLYMIRFPQPRDGIDRERVQTVFSNCGHIDKLVFSPRDVTIGYRDQEAALDAIKVYGNVYSIEAVPVVHPVEPAQQEIQVLSGKQRKSQMVRSLYRKADTQGHRMSVTQRQMLIKKLRGLEKELGWKGTAIMWVKKNKNQRAIRHALAKKKLKAPRYIPSSKYKPEYLQDHVLYGAAAEQSDMLNKAANVMRSPDHSRISRSLSTGRQHSRSSRPISMGRPDYQHYHRVEHDNGVDQRPYGREDRSRSRDSRPVTRDERRDSRKRTRTPPVREERRPSREVEGRRNFSPSYYETGVQEMVRLPAGNMMPGPQQPPDAAAAVGMLMGITKVLSALNKKKDIYNTVDSDRPQNPSESYDSPSRHRSRSPVQKRKSSPSTHPNKRPRRPSPFQSRRTPPAPRQRQQSPAERRRSLSPPSRRRSLSPLRRRSPSPPLRRRSPTPPRRRSPSPRRHQQIYAQDGNFGYGECRPDSSGPSHSRLEMTIQNNLSGQQKNPELYDMYSTVDSYTTSANTSQQPDSSYGQAANRYHNYYRY